MIVQLFIVYYSLPYGIAYMANRFFAADIKAFDVPGLVTIYVTYIIGFFSPSLCRSYGPEPG